VVSDKTGSTVPTITILFGVILFHRFLFFHVVGARIANLAMSVPAVPGGDTIFEINVSSLPHDCEYASDFCFER
jgi:hypothetical protein